MTRFVGIIGYPLQHSISPAFQQAAFDHLGLDIRYEVWETERRDLPVALEGMRHPSKLGGNVTIPHKEAVLPLLDSVDRDAERIGAVNTIVNRGGKLAGHNTDSIGFLKALYLDGAFVARNKRAVLLGAGGAARAVGFSLAEAGARSLTIVNRTPERAEALETALKVTNVEVLSLPWTDEQVERALAGCDLLVNCTSVGLKGSSTEGQSPLRASLIPKGALVYDLVYNPAETPLLAAARRAGARTLGGLPMLVYQGAASFELWTGKPAPVDIMMAVARRAF
jgi:shikimate dehydrogenase